MDPIKTKGAERKSPARRVFTVLAVILVIVLVVLGLNLMKGKVNESAAVVNPEVNVEEWPPMWEGFRGDLPGHIGHFANSSVFNIEVNPDGTPNMATNQFPVSSPESKAAFMGNNGMKTSVTFMRAWINANKDLCDLYNIEPIINVNDYIEQRDDGLWYYNEKGRQKWHEINNMINSEEIIVFLDWMYADEAVGRQNAENTGSKANYRLALAYEPNKNMTIWRVARQEIKPDGTGLIYQEHIPNLTRCGNMVPPKEKVPEEDIPPPPEEEIPKKQAPKVQPKGTGFEGKPDNSGNPPSSSIDQPRVGPKDGSQGQTKDGKTITIDPEKNAGDEYIPPKVDKGSDTYTPPNPKIEENKPPKKDDPPPVVVVPPSEPPISTDVGGF